MENIDVVIVNYNGIRTILNTIQSIYDMEGLSPHIILMDDGSTDGSPQAVAQAFPEVEIIISEQNTKAVNKLRNRGMARARTDKVLLTDNDITFDPHCLREMINVMNSGQKVACCIPRLMYQEHPDRINMCGGKIHYIAAFISPERDKLLSEANLHTGFGVGGGIALFKREVFEAIGGFDEDYMLAWGDDGELQQRILLAGYQVQYVHSAFGLHEAKPFTKERHYRATGQIFNRWLLLLTHYDTRTLLLMLPMLLMYEIVQLCFFTIKGIPGLYFQGNLKLLRSIPLVWKKRQRIQAIKCVSDKEIVFSGPIFVVKSSSGLGRLVEHVIHGISNILNVYWRIISPLIRSYSGRR